MNRWLVGALALAFATASAPAGAAASHPMHPPKKRAPAGMHVPPAPPDAVTQHSVTINGKVYKYTARAGTITLRNHKQQPTARMFYVAYTLNGANPSTRPVTFLYNGGPGSSTVWLRMGAVGPVRLVSKDGGITGPPPYQLKKNPYSLLDKSDLVFIDAPGTGYGRLIGAGKPKEFYGVDQDVRAFAQFIDRYVTTYNRWNSPKFLFGESYGTTRSAALVNYMQMHDGMTFNGVVLQSSILNFALDWATNFTPVSIGGGDWAYVLYLPSEAATAWYHHAIPNRPAHLQPFLQKVQKFAMGEYLHDLALGTKLSPAAYNDVVAKLHRYTGLSSHIIRINNLRVAYYRFEQQLLLHDRKFVGRLDSRFEDYDIDGGESAPPWDPTDSAIDGVFTSTNMQYLRNDLHYKTNIPYRIVNYGKTLAHWDFKHNGMLPTNVAVDLAQAMTYNPNLKIYSANGYFDLATPYLATVYTLQHLNINPALQKNITFGFYHSGHMIYLHTAALAQYKANLARWYDMVLHRR
ncbi:MAG: S10 family peptidase [Vulcanimicrobiaceae bacterium]